MDLAGDPRFPTPPHAKDGPAGEQCPSDEEWRALRLAEALERAYRRAAACYATQRSRGVPWDQVR